jgi:TonB-dependent starch-binding outer membrane protein SusC
MMLATPSALNAPFVEKRGCLSLGFTHQDKTFKSMKKELQVHGHLLFIMKVSFVQFLLTAALISVAYAGDISAQVLEKRISLELHNTSLRVALGRIEKQADVKFLYESQLIPSSEKVTLNIQHERLADALAKMLSPRKIHFEAEGNQIILTKMLTSSAEVLGDDHVAIQVTGVVTDEQDVPLPGVSVLVKNTTTGTTTDGEGKFSISAPDQNSILVFSFIGYEVQEVTVGEQTSVNIRMQPDITSLDEVVVIGYGEVKKSDLTGSVASIKSEDINAYPATNLMQSLAGRAPGVQIMQNTGAPGSPLSVRIRGTNSVLGGNEPLYVVDGFPYSGGPTLLNNADIESIEVLKDASATAIYGSRGANGVVIITTKRGKSGATRVEYDGYYGWQQLRKKIDLMNAREYAEFYNEQAANDGVAAHFTADEVAAFGEGTDWQDLVFQTAPIQNHALSVSGGNENTQFSVSASNFNQDGIVIGSNYIRNSVRTNIGLKLSKKFRFDMNAILSRIDTDRKDSGYGNRGSSLISAVLSAYPTQSPRTADGGYTNLATAYSWGSNNIVNPLNFIEQQTDQVRSNRLLANGAVTWQIIEGLSVKVSGGIENTDDRQDVYTTRKFVNSTGTAGIYTRQVSSVLNENTINYIKDFGNHSFSAVAGFTYQNLTATRLDASGSGFVSDVQGSHDIGAASNQGVPFSLHSEWSLLSYLGRLNYSFKSKYLATISFRADGSSRYSEGQKWSTFPSASLAWRLSDEEFIKQNLAFVSDLKLRAGYGETGSTAIDPYQTLNQLQSGKVVFGDALITAYAPGTRLAGPLKWETTAQTNIGVDMGFLENRFTLSLDYYIKNTRDLLNTVPLPSSLGYAFTYQNIGKVQNKGLEIGASAAILEGPFTWNVSANLSMNKNKVVKLHEGNDVLGEAINISVINDNINILREGEAIGSFYGYVSNGYDDNGFVTYEDFNGNGIRDIGDKRIIGDPNPDFIYGFNSVMSFKNFELNVFIQGSQGNDIFNLSAVNQTNDYGQALNMPREVYNDHWTTDNTDAKYAIIRISSQPQVSDRFIEDGSYLRFKNIQLSYNLPVVDLGINWLSKAQVYVSAQNLITITKYSWYDPEINSYGGASSIRQGIDHYSYPTAKSITTGVRLSF